MQKGNKKYTRQEIVDEIIRQSGSKDRFSDELSERIRHWMADPENSSEKDAALLEAFEQDVVYRAKPSKRWEQALPALKKRLGMEAQETPKIPLRRKTYFRIASAAAAILLIAGVGLTLYQNRNVVDDQPIIASVEIVADTVTRMTELADGSGVWIKEGSTINHAGEFGNERKVTLKGEAFFNVARDEEKPFVVQAGDIMVRVLGTEFNVQAYKDENFSKVTVSSGRVEVSITDIDEPYILEANDELLYDRAKKEVSVYNTEVNDWRTDAFFLRNSTMDEILRKIESYYGVTIYGDSIIRNTDPYTLSLTGRETLRDVMNVIARLQSVDYEIIGNEVIINPK